jgi:hypothetical protein
MPPPPPRAMFQNSDQAEGQIYFYPIRVSTNETGTTKHGYCNECEL